MTQLTSTPSLNDHGWTVLTDAIEGFEASWTKAPCPDLAAFLPADDDALRNRILSELIKADMDYRARGDHRKSLESYLRDWPQLPEETSVELLRSECLVRILAGERVTSEEIIARFPSMADAVDLPGLLAEARRDGAAEVDTSPSSARTKSEIEIPDGIRLVCGESFGRYQILDQLGAGSMGTVYRAYDPNLDRQVALKIPQSDDPVLLERFLREARLAARIRHKNVCPIYDADRARGASYLTMALIDGITLAESMESGRQHPREAAELVLQIATALQQVHDQGIVHRDVKPSNIMLDKNGQPLLMDFGLARGSQLDVPSDGGPQSISVDVTRASTTGPMIGTPAYMAPEQVHGQSIDHRSDLYSLGVLLYQLLTGELPFRGSVEQVLKKVAHETPRKPRDICASIPESLEQICLRAMAKDPDARYGSAEEFAAELEQYLSVSRSRWRRRVLAVAAGLVVGLSAVLIFFKTGSGTLELDLPDQATVVIDEEDHQAGAGRALFRLTVGKHRLRVFIKDVTIADQSIRIRWRGDRVAGNITAPPVAVSPGWNRTGYDLGRTYHFPVPTRRVTTNQLERVLWKPLRPIGSSDNVTVAGQAEEQDVSNLLNHIESIACVRTGDLNDDGSLEIVVRAGKNVIAYDQHAVELWRRTPIDDAIVEIPPDFSDLVAFIELADFNQDGSMEVLTLASANPPDKWIESSFVKTVVYDTVGSRVDSISVFEQVARAHGTPAGCFDFNGDGLPDLVLALAVWGHPHGVFVYDVASQDELFSTLFADQPCVAGVGDVDGDGALDMYLLQEWDSHVDEPVGDYDAHHCYATLFDLNGERKWKQTYQTSLDGCLADLDADGVIDIILFNSTPDQGALYVLDAETGEPRATYEGFGNSLFRRWSVADIDDDGYLDVVFGDGEQILAVSFGAELQPRLLRCVEAPETRVAVTNDVNGDGKIEIIAFQRSDLVILDNELNELTRFVACGAIRDVIVSDINNDGINELILQAGPDEKVTLEIVRFSTGENQSANVMLPKSVANEFLLAVRRNDTDAAVALTIDSQRDSMRRFLIENSDLSLPADLRMNIFHQQRGRALVTLHGSDSEAAFQLELERREGRWWARRILR